MRIRSYNGMKATPASTAHQTDFKEHARLTPKTAMCTKLRALLTAHDDDGHGTLTVDKLKRVLQTFGYPDDKNLRDLIKESAIDSASYGSAFSSVTKATSLLATSVINFSSINMRWPRPIT